MKRGRRYSLEESRFPAGRVVVLLLVLTCSGSQFPFVLIQERLVSVADLHAECETETTEFTLDLDEPLPAEVLGSQQLRLRPLHELTDEHDILVGQAVESSHREFEFVHTAKEFDEVRARLDHDRLS